MSVALKNKIEWAEIDWSQSTRVIAEKTGKVDQEVSRRRKRFAPETMSERKPIDWLKIDWNEGTAEIARRIGRKIEIVSRKRKQYAPETVYINRSSDVNWTEINWNESTSVISKKIKKTRAWVSEKRRQLAPETIKKRLVKGTRAKRNSIDWSMIDWKDSTSSIARRIGKTPDAVSRKRRQLAPETMSLNR